MTVEGARENLVVSSNISLLDAKKWGFDKIFPEMCEVNYQRLSIFNHLSEGINH
jgi:hypothetical protein